MKLDAHTKTLVKDIIIIGILLLVAALTSIGCAGIARQIPDFTVGVHKDNAGALHVGVSITPTDDDAEPAHTDNAEDITPE